MLSAMDKSSHVWKRKEGLTEIAVYKKRGWKMKPFFVNKVMERKWKQVIINKSKGDPQKSDKFELKGVEGGVQLPTSGKDNNSEHVSQ